MFEIKWSHRAQRELNNTLIYWNERNKSNSFSKKIIDEIEIKQDYLLNNPNSGIPLKYKSVYKIQILIFFSLIYELNGNQIEILAFWDNRRNPEDLKIK